MICCRIISAAFLLVYCVDKLYGQAEDQDCPSREHVIPVADIQIAFNVSRLAYNVTYTLMDQIPGTEFTVTFVHQGKNTDNPKDPGFRVIVVEHEDTTIVAYRGTDTTDQLLEQGVSHWKTHSGVPYTIDGEETKVNKFFLDGFRLLQGELQPWLQNPTRKYILTGHSLGGAMASLLAIEMTQVFDGSIWKNPHSSLITFGQPRVGNQAYADKHDELISPWRKLRMVNNRDPIVRVPFAPDYVHHSREIFMDTIRKWTSRFPFVKRTKFWRVCDEQEDLTCSRKHKLSWNFLNHKRSGYAPMINQLPSVYETISKEKKTSFTDAIMGSCGTPASNSSSLIYSSILPS